MLKTKICSHIWTPRGMTETLSLLLTPGTEWWLERGRNSGRRQNKRWAGSPQSKERGTEREGARRILPGVFKPLLSEGSCLFFLYHGYFHLSFYSPLMKCEVTWRPESQPEKRLVAITMHRRHILSESQGISKDREESEGTQMGDKTVR